MTNRWQFCDDNTMSAWVILIINSILLGVGLAMDAFSVSVANGMQDPHMSTRRTGIIAGCFAGFQFLMPMLGWLCIHTILSVFEMFRPFIPWIAFFLLLFIGGKMILDGIKTRGGETVSTEKLTGAALLMQGIATSIDALSVGFTIADDTLVQALISCLLIGIVTLIICLIGLKLGKKIGQLIAHRATIFGGLILMGIGLEILIRSFL